MVVVLWVVFRAESLTQAGEYLKIMFGGAYAFADEFFMFYFNSSKWVLLIGGIFALPVLKNLYSLIVDKLLKSNNGKKFSIVIDLIESLTVMALFVLCVILCINSTYNPFIYFNF